MAKKKQRKRTGPGRAGAGAATATSSGRARTASNDSEAAATVKPAPASPGGPNRQERKEAARLARERLRRRAVRRRLYRRAAISLVVVGLVGGVVLLATKPKAGSALNAQEKQLLAQAPAALTSAGCGSVQTTKDYPDGHDRTHIGDPAVPTLPPLSSYPTVPPASGPHNPIPLGHGIYSDPPPIDQAIHSLEHAAVIIWYSPSAASDPAQAQALAALTDFFRQDRESEKVIVAPYNYPDQGAAGQLPQGKNMVLVSWHHLQTCDQISLPVAYDFVAHYRSPAPKGETYKGTAPEPNVAIG